MEEWEKETIRKNKEKLIELTICNCLFLASLEASGILGKDDLSILKTQGKSQMEQTTTLYDIIQTRVGGYQKLLIALNDTSQSGALSILTQSTPLDPDSLFVNYDENSKLGRGKFATVFKGQYGDKPAAVKRLFFADENERGRIENEIKILQRCDEHGNIIRCFTTKTSVHFALIVLELCDMTLKEWVEIEGNKPIQIPQRKVLRQITKGLEYLHEQGILFSGVTPENILLKKRPKKVKISGFGLSAVLKTGGNVCFLPTSEIADSMKWKAPEMEAQANKNQNEPQDCPFASDVYSLGCMYYYVLTDGRNDFAEVKSLPDLETKLQNNCDDSAQDILLIRKMISDNPEKRPSCTSLLSSHSLKTEDTVTPVKPKPPLVTLIEQIKEQKQDLADKMGSNQPTQSERTPDSTSEISLIGTVEKRQSDAKESTVNPLAREKIVTILKGLKQIGWNEHEVMESINVVISEDFSSVQQVAALEGVWRKDDDPNPCQKVIETSSDLQIATEINSEHIIRKDDIKNIEPFTESNQVEFLLRFWKMKGAAENKCLKQFATECVSTINSNMTDFERDIAGIPLQCRMLAECYTEQALKWSQIGAPVHSKPPDQINSIFEMYERHIKMRLQNQVEEITNTHIYFALELLFPEQVHQFQFLKTPSVSLNELSATGFLEATNSENVQFVHRTFAEFFVAWFAVEMKMPEKVKSFLLDELLATKSRQEYIRTPLGEKELGTSHRFNYPVIAYFINCFCKINSKNQGDQHHSIRVSLLMNSVHYGQVSRIFLASAVSDYQFVPLLVSLSFKPLQISENVDSDIYKLLLISAKYSSVALFITFCSQIKLTNLKNPFKIGLVELTPLHVAVQRGHYHLVEFLTEKYELELKNLRCLLHFCVFESLKDNKETVTNKGQIIRLLSRKSGVWLNEKCSNGTVPLLQNHVNCELIKCLIECGVDVNVLDKDDNTILHKITENPVTPEFYHWLVFSLNQRKFIYFNQPNSSGRKVRPLHCSLEKVELLEETLKYFKLNRVNFNAEDKYKESPLFYAIRGGRSVSLICALIELGADWKKSNYIYQTVLHTCANVGHYHAMKHFVETLKINVNAKDFLGKTPLHYAVMRRSKDYELMQQFLVKSGADVNARYQTDFTPFDIGLRDGEGLSLSTIQLMEEHGLSVGEEQASKAIEYFLSNRNIKCRENVDEFLGVLQFLIEKGGVIQDIPDFNRFTIIWKTTGVQRNMRAIIRSTDLDCLWPHLETSGLLTKSELEDIQYHSADSFNKCQRFYELLESKKGSFERVCTLLRESSQRIALTLLRQSLYSASTSGKYMFLSPPTFTNKFLHSPANSDSNTMALVTTNSHLTINRIRETTSKKVVEIEESNISSYLQKHTHEDVIVLKVRVVTSELISNLEISKAAQCKILFVCSAVDDDVQNCHVVTDSLSTWEDISTQYFKKRARLIVVYNDSAPIFELFESPLILNKLSQLNWIIGEFSRYYYSVERYKMGHNDLEFQSKSYLCPTIFHYVLPNKLVFHGIAMEKLKESARFGQKIGTFGKDDLDYVLIENSQQFDEICRQTSANVHLVEYLPEIGVFKLAKTFGWDENIQSVLKQQLCEGFPHCECAPGSENLVVSLVIKAKCGNVIHRFECVFSIKELTPKTLKIIKLEYAEEFFNIRTLFKRMSGKLQVMNTDYIGQSHGEQIVELVTEHLSPLLVEKELYHVAINTLFPNLAKQTNVMEGLEKYEQLGMLKQTNNKQMVFVDQSLAWYFIAKLCMGSLETEKFVEITAALRKEVLQNCFECHDLEMTRGYYRKQVSVCVNSPSQELSSYKFINIHCFKFIDAILKNTSGRNCASFSNFLRSIVAVDPEGYKWIYACVHANLFHLLQLIFSFKMNALSFALDFNKLVVLAVNYADVPITRLVAEQFEKKTKGKLTEIKIYLHQRDISMVSLAALRGNYGLVEYLLNDQCFRLQLHDHKVLEVLAYCLDDTSHVSKYEVNERKRIVDLFLTTDDVMVLQRILPSSWNVHVDLIVYLISLGADIHAKDKYNNNNILHRCPEYLTPPEYHEIVSLIHLKDSTCIARLFKEINNDGETAFHVAVEELELLDETIDLFSEAQVDFNDLNEDGDSVFVRAVKCLRSARLLDALYRSGADIHAKDGKGRPASVYCWKNKMALRYLSSRGITV